MPRTSIFSLDDSAQREVELYARTPGWQRIKGDQAPSFLPDTLRARSKELVVVATSASTSSMVVMFNIHRVDAPAGMIDHEPLVVVVSTTGSSTAGCFYHHGDWKNRSTPLDIPADFSGAVNSSGIAGYFRANPSTDSTGGSLDTLPDGDRAAFERITGIEGIGPIVHRSV